MAYFVVSRLVNLVVCGTVAGSYIMWSQAAPNKYGNANTALRNPYTYCVVIDDRHRKIYHSSIFIRSSASSIDANEFSIALAKRFPVVAGTGQCFEAKDQPSAQKDQASLRSQWQYAYNTIDTGWNPASPEVDVPRLIPQKSR